MDWPGLWVSAVRGIVYLERQAISGHHEQCFFSYLCPCRERSQSAGGGVVPKSHLALATPMACVPSSSSVHGISQGKRQKQEIKGNKTSKDRRLWIASLKQGPLKPKSSFFFFFPVEVKVAQSCPTICDPMDCSLPDSSVHGVLQAKILEWVTIPFSRESSKPRDQSHVSCIAGGFFTFWATREAQEYWSL